MKKNVTPILCAVVALAVGYLLGAKFGLNGADAGQTKGDINAVNTYKQLLCDPDYMAFNDGYTNDDEAIARTISTLTIIQNRLQEFRTLAILAQSVQSSDAELSDMAGKLVLANKQSDAAYAEAEAALAAAKQLQAGQEVKLKKALQNATDAYDALGEQMKVCHAFIEQTDAFLQGKNVLDHIVLATLRDMVVSYNAVNASLTQNDLEIDYWQNFSGLLTQEQMASVK